MRVLVRQLGSMIEIRVTDTGIGIRPDLLPHIFGAFNPGDGSTRRRHGGLGLGLTIARHLTELHGGRLTAESAGEGQGATFTVTLPIHAVQRTEPQASPGAAAATTLVETGPSLAGLSVLVVDDEADARELASAVLAGSGAHVSVAESARDALEQLMADRPDVLVSDIAMPEEDGYDLIRQVRALRIDQGGAVPAIALTAYARAEDRRQALAAGYQQLIVKPIAPVELVSAVSAVSAGAGRRGTE